MLIKGSRDRDATQWRDGPEIAIARDDATGKVAAIDDGGWSGHVDLDASASRDRVLDERMVASELIGLKSDRMLIHQG